MVNDQMLVSAVLNGDSQAFRVLIRHHERLVSHMIMRIVKNREECEELCQDVFLRVYQKLGEFNFQSRLSTWIATIAYRSAINHLRKNKIQWNEMPEEENGSFTFVDAENPQSILEDRDMDEFILSLAEQLPLQYRTVLTLYHVNEMNYKEIGEITGMPEGTVKNYLFRARHLLKEKVKKYLGKENYYEQGR